MRVSDLKDIPFQLVAQDIRSQPGPLSMRDGTDGTGPADPSNGALGLGAFPPPHGCRVSAHGPRKAEDSIPHAPNSDNCQANAFKDVPDKSTGSECIQPTFVQFFVFIRLNFLGQMRGQGYPG